NRFDEPLARPRRRTATLAERWLASLTGAPRFADPDEDVTTLQSSLDAWYGDVSRATGPVKVLFRLTEPDDTDNWRVQFALQSTSDQSLVIPAEQVWDGATAGTVHPDEALLAGLGRASRLFPLVDDALHEAKPTGLTLST